MDKYMALTQGEVIKIIERIKESTIFVITMDLEKENISCEGEQLSVPQGLQIIKQAKTRVYLANNYVSQIRLYNVSQNLYCIQPKGVMKIILLPRTYHNKQN